VFTIAKKLFQYFLQSTASTSFASSGVQTPGILAQLLSPKKNGLGSPIRKPGTISPSRKTGTISPTRKSGTTDGPKNQNGSPKRRSNKSDPSDDTGKPDSKLGPIRKTRNLPKLEKRKNGSDEFGNPPPLPPTSSVIGPKKSGGANVMNDLDTVAESPTESLE
jgi:hypothetical protein